MAKKKTGLPVASAPVDCAPYKPTKADVDRERRYRAQDALQSIQRAAEVKADKQLMKDVKSLIKEQSKAIAKL